MASSIVLGQSLDLMVGKFSCFLHEDSWSLRTLRMALSVTSGILTVWLTRA